jgi:hypothetical protein
MALTIAIEGLGVIANADAETNDTGGNGTGDWGFTGSGGVSNGLTTDTFYFGTSSIAMALSGSGKNGWLYFNRGSALNFSTTLGGQFIYIWVHCPTLGLSQTKANIGIGIRAGTSTGVYRTWTIGGSDDSNGWDGKWKCFVIDPTKAGSVADNGSYNPATVQFIGIKGETTATAKGDNFFISQIAVGSGLRITGDSTTSWQDIATYCTDLPNRAWGMMQKRGSIFFGNGKFNIGSSTQTAITDFADAGRVIQWEDNQYWDGTTWITSLPTNAYGIVVEDAVGFATTFEDGAIVGLTNGRSGTTFIGNVDQNVSMDLYGGNNGNSLTLLYGTKFQNIKGAINSGNLSKHKFLGCSFVASSQFDPVGAPLIRNCTFAETVDVDAALMWNESIDIVDCSFIANTLGAAIENPSSAGTPYDYDALSFSGNTFDVLNSSGAAITINTTNGTNASTSEGSAVTFAGSVPVTVTVVDSAQNPIEGATVYLLTTTGAVVVLNGLTNASGVISGTFSGTTPVAIDSTVSGVKHGSSPIPYTYFTLGGSITTSGYSQTAILTVD